MSDAEKDFHRSLRRSKADLDRTMSDQSKDFNKQLTRNRSDLDRSW